MEMIQMMLLPTEEELKLIRKMDNAKTESEKARAKKELKKYLNRQEAKLKNCPFAH